MLYFLLPELTFDIKPDNLKLEFVNKKENIYISKSISKYLKILKKQIDIFIHNWDNMKKFTNPYEFIHTNIPHHSYSISKIKPVSRSFFKLIEIVNSFNLIDEKVPITSFHLAEGPGGFIEATAHLRNNPDDVYYGMTLIDKSNYNIPGWKKSENFIKKYPNVKLIYGKTQDGNLYSEHNLEFCYKNFKNKIEFITADGGFDFSIDYNDQENMAFRLIFTQVIYALTMQKKNGSFVIKIYDIFLKSTVQIIYLLCCFYRNVYISKPNTSRYANSEKYIICSNFKFDNINMLYEKFYNILKVLNGIDFDMYNINSILDIPMQLYSNFQIEEINAILGQQQIDNIYYTIKLICNKENKKEKIDNIKLQNIQKCIHWCNTNNIPHNNFNDNTNIFLNK